MKINKILRSLSVLLICATSIIGCGGGGGGGGSGDGFVGAADSSIEVSPSSIDTGDRTQVTISLSSIHDNGIVLKVRYPKGLAYVPSSAFLNVNNKQVDIGPQKNQTKETYTYLVFFLTADQFGTDGEGEVIFELVGNSAVEEGLVEVDADVNDPLTDDGTEFNVNKPEFGTEESADISVI
ncbi:MAG: hypothetical protein J0M12_11875 [Deltaproteobacteria bacterium]|nr:hypothetical protein [Deltaproteobacteria bacterium]